MTWYLDRRLHVKVGDITAMKTDAIVNAANSSLMGGGGVDGAIHRAGGPQILRECREIRARDYPDGLPPGEAVMTGAGNLPARAVIHTVGPVWHGGNRGEKETLRRAYLSCLTVAFDHGLRSIAFPAISTGVYGFPRELAAPIAFSAVRDFLADHDIPGEIVFVYFSHGDYDAFVSTVQRMA